MPCRDGGPGEAETLRELSSENRFLEATLCGILSAGFDLDHVNWKEAGVSQQDVLKWWKKHQAADERRKQRERENKLAELERKKALRDLLEREIRDLNEKFGDTGS